MWGCMKMQGDESPGPPAHVLCTHVAVGARDEHKTRTARRDCRWSMYEN